MGYLKDKFTLLPETTDRIAATSITATWRYEYTGALAISFCERVSWKLLLSSMQSIRCCQVQHGCRAALKMSFQCDPARSTALALPLSLQADSVFCGSCCHHQSTTCAALIVPVSTASPGACYAAAAAVCWVTVQHRRPHLYHLYTGDFESHMIVCRYTGPVDYDKAFQEIKTALGEAFWGPPKSGVYSPSVQYTLFQMAKLALQRCIVSPAALQKEGW